MTESGQKQWTILAVLRWTTNYFREKGVTEFRASAEVLLAHALGLSRLDLYLRHDQPLTKEELARFKDLMRRRCGGEPTAYLTGHKEFWSLDFLVTPGVLIPRPETEILVEAALQGAGKFFGAAEGGLGTGKMPVPQFIPPSPASPPLHLAEEQLPGWTGEQSTLDQSSLKDQQKTEKRKKKKDQIWGLEVGVGSGAVVVALARELPQMTWVAVDVSAAALAVARENARRHGVANRVHFLQGDLLSAIKPGARFALIVANLPYVSRKEWEALPKDIRAFEPPAALLGGEDGLALLRPLARLAHAYLRPGGQLTLEVGQGQAEEVKRLLEETAAYDQMELVRDYLGLERVVRGSLRRDA